MGEEKKSGRIENIENVRRVKKIYIFLYLIEKENFGWVRKWDDENGNLYEFVIIFLLYFFILYSYYIE